MINIKMSVAVLFKENVPKKRLYSIPMHIFLNICKGQVGGLFLHYGGAEW